MADVSDPAIAQGMRPSTCGAPCSPPPAYEDVRSDKSETTWLLLDYEVRCRQVRRTAGADDLPVRPL